MHVLDTANLNRARLAEYLQQRGLSQAGLAQRLGVTPLTVSRWLSGRIRRISLDNLRRVAAELGCREQDLRANDALDVESLRRERSVAARLLISPTSRHLFYEAGRLAEYEQLILAMMDPQTPPEDLLEAYSLLIILASKRGQPELVARYAALKLRYALSTGNQLREQEARVNLLTAQAECGRLVQACRALEGMLSAAESEGASDQMQVALINLIQAYRLRGEVARALACALRCLELQRAQPPHPSYCAPLYDNLSSLLLECREYSLANRVGRLADSSEEEPATPQEAAEIRLNSKVSESLQGMTPDLEELPALIACYLGSERFTDGSASRPALLLRRAGRLVEAREYLHQLHNHAACGVFEDGFISEEWARLESVTGRTEEALHWRKRANELFLRHGMQRRCSDDPAQEAHALPAPPRAGLRRLQALLDNGT